MRLYESPRTIILCFGNHTSVPYLTELLYYWMTEGCLSPDEVMACAQEAASSYRAGRDPSGVATIGTDGEVCP
jgi:hypothetical protein